MLGIMLAGVDFVTARLFPGLLGALLTVTAWKLLTGGLHLDGLADCLDGLVGRDREHRLAIMRDSRIGTFGAVGLILFLMLEIVTVGELPPERALARADRGADPGPGAAAGARALLSRRAAHRSGRRVCRRRRPPGRADRADHRRHSSRCSRCAPPARRRWSRASSSRLAVAWFQSRRLGGLTGDVLGATVELAELAALLTVLAWLNLRP